MYYIIYITHIFYIFYIDKHPQSSLLTLAKRQFSHLYKATEKLCSSTA